MYRFHRPIAAPQALQEKWGGATRAKFVKGFYNESLTDAALAAHGRRMRPAVYVDVDCDLYVSTYQVLPLYWDCTGAVLRLCCDCIATVL
eukprot:3736722-Pyramimonas_sp.AAC.2